MNVFLQPPTSILALGAVVKALQSQPKALISLGWDKSGVSFRSSLHTRNQLLDNLQGNIFKVNMFLFLGKHSACLSQSSVLWRESCNQMFPQVLHRHNLGWHVKNFASRNQTVKCESQKNPERRSKQLFQSRLPID